MNQRTKATALCCCIWLFPILGKLTLGGGGGPPPSPAKGSPQGDRGIEIWLILPVAYACLKD